MVAETEPFGSNENDKEEEEEKGWWRFVSLTVATHTTEREKRMSEGRMSWLEGFVWEEDALP